MKKHQKENNMAVKYSAECETCDVMIDVGLNLKVKPGTSEVIQPSDETLRLGLGLHISVQLFFFMYIN